MAFSLAPVLGRQETAFYVTPEHFSILDQHKMLDGVVEPYWKVMRETPKTPMFETFMRGKMIVRIGQLTAFEVADMANIVEYGYQSYLAQETFGDFDPKTLPEEELALHARMVSGFHRNMTFVSVLDANTGVVVGGSIVNPGTCDRLLVDSVGKKDSGLPTFYSLQLNVGELGTLNERQCVCYSRFWHLPVEVIRRLAGERESLKPYLAQLSREILSGLGRASLSLQIALGRDYAGAWFDTTDSGVRNTVVKNYGAVVIDEKPVATGHIMQGPLKWHFRMQSEVGYFPAKRQIELANAVDEELGPKEKLYWSL